MVAWGTRSISLALHTPVATDGKLTVRDRRLGLVLGVRVPRRDARAFPRTVGGLAALGARGGRPAGRSRPVRRLAGGCIDEPPSLPLPLPMLFRMFVNLLFG